MISRQMDIGHLPSGFLEKFTLEPNSGCWLWLGRWHGAKRKYGYYQHEGRQYLAHRLSYELLVGEIPEGLVIDHLCRTPPCVNPEHMEIVTIAENVRRGHFPNTAKTHCPQGHLYSGDNLRVFSRYSGGSGKNRHCVACTRVRQREYWRRKHGYYDHEIRSEEQS